MSSDVPERRPEANCTAPWPSMAFSEAVEINPKRPLPKAGDVPFLDMAALPLNGAPVQVLEKRPASSGGARFQAGDTLFARITPCAENGKLGFVSAVVGGATAQGSTEFVVMGARDGLTLPEYVRWLSGWGFVRDHAIGLMEGTSGRQRIPAWAFDEIEVGVPPLDEQLRIAEVLRSVDEAIAATITSNEQAQLTLNSARANFLKPTEGVTALGDVCDVIGGYAFKSTSFIKSGVKVLRISNITETGVDFSGRAVCVSQQDVRGLDRFRLKPLDTVVALSGATTGKMCVFLSDDAVYANQRVAFIRVRTGLAEQAYINHALSMLTASVRQSAYGGAQPNISTKDIALMGIALPSLPEQREIADILDVLSQAVALGDQALSAHQTTKTVLLSDLLSGHVRVPA